MSGPPSTSALPPRSGIDEVIAQARRIANVLRVERDKARSDGREAGEMADNVDQKLTRRVVFDIAGDFLRELAEKRATADQKARQAADRAARASAVAQGSSRQFTETRRLRGELSRTKARAKQANAKFQLVYDTVLESEVFESRFEKERLDFVAEREKCDRRAAECDDMLSRMEQCLGGLIMDRDSGETVMDVDLALVTKSDVMDAAQMIIEARDGFELIDEAAE